MKSTRLAALFVSAVVVGGACTAPGAQPSATGGGSTSAPTGTAPAGSASAPASASAPVGGSASPSASAAATDPMATHGGMGTPTASGSPAAGGAVTDSEAANLRNKLDYLLGEHIIFASKATGAALGGRNEEFAAYGALLNTNGTELGEMVGAAFGDEAKDSFNKIWSAHNGFFVDYTTGVAKNDMAMQDKAVNDLTTIYVPQFTELISGATGLPSDAVEKLTTDHVLQTKAIVDAQAKKDWKGAYAAIRTAYAHMRMIGDPVSTAIAQKLPEAFPGDAANDGVSFRVALNGLLQEHLYLASSATGAALDGRNEEFAAAGDALNANGTDIGAAIGSLYGDEAKDAFNKIWSAHNGFFVDYTTGVAMKDQAKADKAVNDLTTIYVPQFSEFLAGATGLPQDAVAQLTTEHVLTTKAIVDAQAAKDAEAAATADRTAGQHMQMIGDALAKAIVAKFPDKF